jgi:hypothetical protein
MPATSVGQTANAIAMSPVVRTRVFMLFPLLLVRFRHKPTVVRGGPGIGR